MKYIGIDGGFDGAIAIIDDTTKAITVIDMPTLTVMKEKAKKDRQTGQIHKKPVASRTYDLHRICDHFRESIGTDKAFCILEKARPMPDQGITSMFTTGWCYGAMMGILAGMGIPYRIEEPSKWQTNFSISKKLGGKDKSIEVASRLYPDQKFVTPRGRKLHGRSDAALIARYAQSIHYESSI